MLLSDEIISNSKWVADMQLSDRIGRRLKLQDLHVLVTVVIPEIVMTSGHLVPSMHDARIYAALVGAAYFFWKRGVLGTMLVGMAVYLPLHLGLAW